LARFERSGAAHPCRLKTNVKTGEGYVPEIDGLRAIAVLCVFLYHLHAAFLPGGFTGVDVFFVISGYVVSRSLAQHSGSGLLGFLKNFYARRFLRILPALFVCLLATTALTVVLIPDAWLSQSIRQSGLAAFFGMSNFALESADSYFSARPAFNPFTQTWSLAVEEQFYLVYPVLLFFLLRAENRARLARRLAQAVLPALFAASFAALCWVSKRDPEAAFYLLPYRFWELAAGALCFQAERSGLRCPPALAQLFAVAGLILILLAAWFADAQACPMPWSIPAVAGTVLVLLSLQTAKTRSGPAAAMLRHPLPAQIGKLSYSLYLWHWPVFVIFRWTAGLYDAAHMAAAAALSFILAGLSYSLVERGFRGPSWVRSHRAWAVLAGGLACALLFRDAARIAYKSEHQLSASIVMRDSADWYPTPPYPVRDAGCGAHWQLQVKGGMAIQRFRLPCGPAPVRRLFVIGDSHASAYDQMLLMLAQDDHIDIRIYSGPGCAYANLLTPAPPACLAFMKSVTAQVLGNARQGDAVFLASLRMPRLADEFAETASSIPSVIAAEAMPAAVAQRRQAYDEAAAAVSQFAAAGMTVLIDAPKPVFAAAAFRCADWYDRGNPMCGGLQLPRAGLLALRQPVMDSLARLRAAYPRVAVWDPFPVLCPGEICAAVTPAGPLFFDGDHLSNTGNRVLYPSFKTFVEQMWKPHPKPAQTRS